MNLVLKCFPLSVIAHTWNPSTQEAESREDPEFKAIVGFEVSSGLAKIGQTFSMEQSKICSL